MFKLIFKLISFLILSVIFLVFLAFWKGGEPFRWTGEKTEKIGKLVQTIGNKIDELKQGGKKAEKKLKDLKEDLKYFTKEKSEASKDKVENEEINKNQNTE
jgi:cell shape-determining protein MreC